MDALLTSATVPNSSVGDARAAVHPRIDEPSSFRFALVLLAPPFPFARRPLQRRDAPAPSSAPKSPHMLTGGCPLAHVRPPPVAAAASGSAPLPTRLTSAMVPHCLPPISATPSAPCFAPPCTASQRTLLSGGVQEGGVEKCGGHETSPVSPAHIQARPYTHMVTGKAYKDTCKHAHASTPVGTHVPASPASLGARQRPHRPRLRLRHSLPHPPPPPLLPPLPRRVLSATCGARRCGFASLA